MSERPNLFSPAQLGELTLANRVVMAPMTRSRAPSNVPQPMMAEYYRQRSEAGLIITEGTAPSPDGLGYARIPGLYSAEHVRGWRLVTDAVHSAGSRIFVQLMHTGRVSHPGNMPPGARVVAPSAIPCGSKLWVDGQGQLPVPLAEALTAEGIETAIADFVRAAELAMEAGFDGVELHGANGYLIEQFLNTAANQRQDDWGGSLAGRRRFALEIARRTAARIGAGRLGIRLSPYSTGGGMRSEDEQVDELYQGLAAELGQIGLAYIHLVDHSAFGTPAAPPRLREAMQRSFGGSLILCGAYNLERASADLAAGHADLIAFGRPFISNPRLPSLLKAGRPLAAPDYATFYSAGEAGYTDYPPGI
jgi:N-ethylmaleimide reductase